MKHLDQDEALEQFLSSTLFSDLFECLKRQESFSFPISPDPFETELALYGKQRLLGHEQVLENLAINMQSFFGSNSQPSKIVLSICIDHNEGYVDIEQREFSGTAFVIDALEADRSEFPLLRSARKYSENKIDHFTYKNELIPSSFIIYAWHLTVCAEMARTLEAGLKRMPMYSECHFTFRLDKTSQRAFVAEW